MPSRRQLFCSFIGAFQHHYKAKLEKMEYPYINDQILNLVLCMYTEQLILSYSLLFNNQNQPIGLLVIFRYINNNGLLFSNIKSVSCHYYLSKKNIAQWIRRKISLIFPILLIETANFGLITDRQFFYQAIRVGTRMSDYNFSGKLIAIIQ